MKDIPVGVKGEYSLVVTADHLANRFKDVSLPPVFATPMMVMLMENAALNAIKPYLGPDESCVGTRVEVRHLAATPVGLTVTAVAELTAVSGRRLTFRIEASDGIETIGTAIHERVVVDRARMAATLQRKSG
jgi:fluoroacetyl-CoA thioesterase